MSQLHSDQRIVLTLDAGGTSLRFSALRGGQQIVETVTLPTRCEDLAQCLNHVTEGFSQVKAQCPSAPVAISFAFPGPADYPNGIIANQGNLPAFRDGVALGPMLEDRFGIPTFINNDGDLFVYGEAIAGFLPYVNGLLERAGSPKRYKVLFGVTLGTGFGGGIVRDGEIFIGDNSGAGEVWLLRNRLDPEMNAEEGASIRAVRRVYAEQAGIAFDEAPEPRIIFAIGTGKSRGDQAAAVQAFRRMGKVVGDALGAALTLVDGLAVIGGGLSGAWPLFLPAVVEELNGTYRSPDGNCFRRLATKAFNLEEPAQLEAFLRGEAKQITVPGSSRQIRYDRSARVGVGISRKGTSEAVAIGAYAFAIRSLGVGSRT